LLRLEAFIFSHSSMCRATEIPLAGACRALTSRPEMGFRGRLKLDNTAMEADGNAAARHGFMSSFGRA
jgi:hypothetical protein